MKTRPLSLFPLLILLASCQKDSITSIWVPKEEAHPAAATLSTKHPEVDWTLPAGWVDQPLADFRVGSFLARAASGQNVDISVVMIPGGAGGMLANINRWRGQIQLGPLEEKDMASQAPLITVGPRQMNLVDFSNAGKRITAATYERQGQTWFFKMTGDDDAVKSTSADFKQFLSSLVFHEH